MMDDTQFDVIMLDGIWDVAVIVVVMYVVIICGLKLRDRWRRGIGR